MTGRYRRISIVRSSRKMLSKFIEEWGSQVRGPDTGDSIASSADSENFATVGDIRQQDVDEGILAIERRTSLVFGGDDSFDGREIALAEHVVLFAKETRFPSIRLGRINPVIQHASADEAGHRLCSVLAVQEQSVAVVVTFVDAKFGELHDGGPFPVDRVNFAYSRNSGIKPRSGPQMSPNVRPLTASGLHRFGRRPMVGQPVHWW